MLVDSTQTQQELLRQIQEQWTDAEKKVDALLRLTPEKQSRRLQLSHIGLRTPVIVEVLLKRAHEQGFLDSEESYSLAKLGFTVATRISGYDDRVGCHQLTWDYQALASAQMANACRIGCWWGSAHENMERAFRLQLLGTGAPRVVARLCSLRASLYKDRRWYDEALLDLRTARELYEAIGSKQDQELAGVLVNMALVHHRLQQLPEAIRTNQRGLDLIDEQRQPNLAAAASINRAMFLTDHEDPETALLSLDVGPSLEELGIDPNSSLFALRQWEIARAHTGLGNFPTARRQLERARDFFITSKNPFDQGLVTLELARLLLISETDTSEFYLTIEEATRLLMSQRLEEEAKEALELLSQSIQAQTLTPAIIALSITRVRATFLKKI